MHHVTIKPPGRRAVAAWAACAAAISGCGPSGSSTTVDGGATPDGVVEMGTATISISPADAVIEIINGNAPLQPFTAIAMFPGGASEDITAQAIFTVADFNFGSFNGNTFRPYALQAGRTEIIARWRGAEGRTRMTQKVQSVRTPATLPNAADIFAGANEAPSRAPLIVYPSRDTLVPPNLGVFDVHWTSESQADLFEVSMSSDLIDVRVYLTAPEAAAPGGFATIFTAAEWGVVGNSVRGGQTTVLVRGMKIVDPTQKGTSQPLSIRVAGDDIAGGMYYWSTTDQGVLRKDFGRPSGDPELFYAPTTSGGRCVGCHALSRDGEKMAGTYDVVGGSAFVIDVATRRVLPWAEDVKSSFTVLEPGGARLLTTQDGVITLRDAQTATAIKTVPLPELYATQPDWAPQADAIIYASFNYKASDWAVWDAMLVRQPFRGSDNTFGAPVTLVPLEAGVSVAYPQFSPDASWVIYNRMLTTGAPGSPNTYNNSGAELYAVSALGGEAPIKLTAANLSTGLTNSWPRWAPFAATTGGTNAEPMYWFTWSSMRAFGTKAEHGQPQIWMAAFIPSRAAAGLDPSTPAFRLPFQDLDTANHIAQWTTTVVPIGKR